MTKNPILTSAEAIPAYNDNASITTGCKRGYTQLEDAYLLQKLSHFNRERLPERVVHAKGGGAGGFFEVTNDLSRFTRANFLQGVGKKTEVFARFSTVGGEKGSADSARDPRGFALKFYTEEGNYDLVANNTPVFFIRDALKFPDFIHSQKRNPQTNLPDYNAFWDFLSLTPESIHQVTVLFSDRGTPQNFRRMSGHSGHTFMWYNKNNEYVWVKYHFQPRMGWQTFTDAEAEQMRAKDPNYSVRDLFNAIAEENYPVWDATVQIMTPEQAADYHFNPFDITKVWYHADFPLIPLGRLTLNRNPQNFFAEVEQIAYSPSHLVPGIAASPDKLLQGRLFAYEDAQRYRLGVNNLQIPVNAPKAAARTYQRDGFMTVNGNNGNQPNYFPNTVPGTPQPCPCFTPPKVQLNAILARHVIPIEEVDFVQANALYSRVLDEQNKAHLISNIAGHLVHAHQRIQYRQCALFYKVNADYGTRVARALHLNVHRVQELAVMSQQARVEATL